MDFLLRQVLTDPVLRAKVKDAVSRRLAAHHRAPSELFDDALSRAWQRNEKRQLRFESLDDLNRYVYRIALRLHWNETNRRSSERSRREDLTRERKGHTPSPEDTAISLERDEQCRAFIASQPRDMRRAFEKLMSGGDQRILRKVREKFDRVVPVLRRTSLHELIRASFLFTRETVQRPSTWLLAGTVLLLISVRYWSSGPKRSFTIDGSTRESIATTHVPETSQDRRALGSGQPIAPPPHVVAAAPAPTEKSAKSEIMQLRAIGISTPNLNARGGPGFRGLTFDPWTADVFCVNYFDRTIERYDSQGRLTGTTSPLSHCADLSFHAGYLYATQPGFGASVWHSTTLGFIASTQGLPRSEAWLWNGVCVDPWDRLHVLDGETGVVHVLDARTLREGHTWTAISPPAGPGMLTCDKEGMLYVGYGVADGCRVVRFRIESGSQVSTPVGSIVELATNIADLEITSAGLHVALEDGVVIRYSVPHQNWQESERLQLCDPEGMPLRIQNLAVDVLQHRMIVSTQNPGSSLATFTTGF